MMSVDRYTCTSKPEESDFPFSSRALRNILVEADIAAFLHFIYVGRLPSDPWNVNLGDASGGG